MPKDGVSDEVLVWLMKSGPLAGSLWKHRKGGTYTIVCTAIQECDLVPVVIYRDATGIMWELSLAEFSDGRFVHLPGPECRP